MHHPRLSRQHATVVACILALVVLAAASIPVLAAPETAAESETASGHPAVTLRQAAVSQPTDGAFEATASIAVDRPTSYLESRIQILNPGGRLLFQKTEIRHDEPTGTVTIGYSRELADLDLAPGIYPIELRVRSESAGEVREWTVSDQLLLYDRDVQAVPVALVVRVSSAPSYDSEGRFVVDPGQSDEAREQVDALARFVLEEPAVRLTLALPPMLAEEWSVIAEGYETSGPEGVQMVDADQPVPRQYGQTLANLKAALDTGRLELLAVPYADPDLTGLESSDRLIDLEDHYARGLSATLASVETSPSAGTAFATDIVPAAAVSSIEQRGIEYFLVAPESLEASEAVPVSGPYRLGPSLAGNPAPIALVTSPSMSSRVCSSADTSVVIGVFERSLSESPSVPIIAVVEMGPGQEGSVTDLRECVAGVGSQPWVEFITAGDAAEDQESGVVTLDRNPAAATQPPAGYFAEVAESRVLASGFTVSVGENDPDVQAANDASLIAQSHAWAGPDGSWASADRGLGFAATAARSAHTVFDALTVSAQDITLSSARGDVPVNVRNDSEKTLLLRVVTTASGMVVPGAALPSVTARPQDNFFTVPVDLQSSLSGRLTVEIYAGDVHIDSTTVTVQASYLDRLAAVGLVVVVLVGLLLFIRRRARRAESAGTIGRDE